MRVAFHDFGDPSLDAYVGGEGRWAVNWIYFLRSLGHEVTTIPLNEVGDFDLYFSLDPCQAIVDKPHIHNHFSSRNANLFKLPCYQKHGTMFLSNPYRSGYEEALPWAQKHSITQLFLPMCYPDALLPKDLAPGFQRQEITWATKDPFSLDFSPEQSYIPKNALSTLKALVRLSKRADFKLNLLLQEFLTEEAKRIVEEIPRAEKQDRLSWSELVQVMGRSKLNVPVGGLSGSCLESIFTKSLPLFYSDITFFPVEQSTCLLPPVAEADEGDIYNALETFWFDQTAYQKAWEHYQDAFQDHRTPGLKENLSLSLDRVFG